MQLPTQLSDKIFLWLAVAATLFALFMHVGIARTNISRQEWAIPAKFIQKHHQKGDLIGLLPPWALKAVEPLRKYPIIYSENIRKEDLQRYKRLWLIVAPNLGKWWFRKNFDAKVKALKRLYWLRQKQVFDKVELYLFQLPPPTPVLYSFSALKNLRNAEVGLETPPNSKRIGRCPSSSLGQIDWLKRWLPHPGWWQGYGNYFFGRIIQEIGDTPRRCLWVEPKRCRIVRIRYRNVPLKGVLCLAQGFATAAPAKVTSTLRVEGPDVELSLWIENQLIKRFRVSPKEIWQKHQIPFSTLSLKLPPTLSPSATKMVSVEFQIQVPKRAKGRTGYCFQAELRSR